VGQGQNRTAAEGRVRIFPSGRSCQKGARGTRHLWEVSNVFESFLGKDQGLA